MSKETEEEMVSETEEDLEPLTEEEYEYMERARPTRPGFAAELKESIDKHDLLYPVLIATSQDKDLDQRILDGVDRLEALTARYGSRENIPKECFKEVAVKDAADFHEKRLETIMRRKQPDEDRRKIEESISQLFEEVAKKKYDQVMFEVQMEYDSFVNQNLRYNQRNRGEIMQELARRTGLSRKTVYKYLPPKLKRSWKRKTPPRKPKSPPVTFIKLYKCPHCGKTIKPTELKEVQQKYI